MSNELESISDPGIPPHVHRKADVDPKAAKKAERQVGILFLLSVFGYFGIVACFGMLC